MISQQNVIRINRFRMYTTGNTSIVVPFRPFWNYGVSVKDRGQFVTVNGSFIHKYTVGDYRGFLTPCTRKAASLLLRGWRANRLPTKRDKCGSCFLVD